MPTPLTSDRVRGTLRQLLASLGECVAAEAAADGEYTSANSKAEAAFAKVRVEIQQAWDSERTAANSVHRELSEVFAADCAAAEAIVEKGFAATTAEITQLYERDEAIATKEYQESGWTLEAIYDAEKKKARESLDAGRRTGGDQKQTIVRIRDDVAARLGEWEQIPKAISGATKIDLGSRVAAQEVGSRIALARGKADALNGFIAPRFLINDRLFHLGIGGFVLFALLLAALGHWAFQLNLLQIVGLAFGGAAAIAGGGALLAKLILAARARASVQALCTPLHQALAESESLLAQGDARAEADCKATIETEKLKYRRELAVAEKQHRIKLAQALDDRDKTTRKAVATRDEGAAKLAEQKRLKTKQHEDDHQHRTASLQERHGGELTRATAEHQTNRRTTQSQFDAAFAALSKKWHGELAAIQTDLAEIAEQSGAFFPDWHAATWAAWQPPTAVPPSLRFGQFEVALPDRPKSKRLQSPPESVTLPALLPFPHRGSTLFRAAADGRAGANQALLATATRFLTALPAGKVRLTIIDPVGLGENFAALMHLADHDPQLVGARIWTEPAQIEKRLADITAHMENVIQKYLRSQYASIEEYNAQAGEVAEPYRVLVVANFPANFSTEAARRLERIAASGASCGVYVLVSHDTALPLPQGYDIADLQRASLNVDFPGARPVWQDSDFSVYPLAIDAPPEGTVLRSTLDRIGTMAKNANRVEVDFAFIAPKPDAIWKADSRAGIDVPLGRAGATKRQHLQLGKGTAQHVLVAGKTGSGKSTLLNALITNLALTYSPWEVELYLIDFKKGVEFKTYANHRLPHARVIAVESEREFGLSVLQRLDLELKRRGDLYRAAGTQDLKGYREASAAEHPLPRILLIVDEFQEFFVEDDRVAQEAALLLDRLVRQGRAFGLHVLLGSQTLGGAYSLARSTIDQMAVRIALQCSEADAGLILSKDNSAARLLSRPGEAIYNDANGLIEGNDIFQVVWLPDERREVYLKDARRRADELGYVPPMPTVVFEGNIPSDLTAHAPLATALNARPTKPPREQVCWLGDAMAIKAPTTAVFRRQSASNLLFLGQQPDPARALFLASALAVLAQQPAGSDSPKVLILDGTPADDPLAGYFGQVFADCPGAAVYSGRESADVLRIAAEEFERRQATPGTAAPALVLFAYGLHRLKDLRKPDDDFSFRRGEGEPSPAQRFATLLREGPTSGVHIVAWCDTLINIQRTMERSALRDFEMKVLFQMSVNDSSTLIDSPAASRLGVNRALFCHEELTAPEKFRPYNLPPAEWVAAAVEQLRRREAALVAAG